VIPQKSRRRSRSADPLVPLVGGRLLSFDSRHYVPVLKVKRGEKRALQLVSPSLQPLITPFLEIVERRPQPGRRVTTVARHLDTAFAGLAESVRSYPRCFLDVHEI